MAKVRKERNFKEESTTTGTGNIFATATKTKTQEPEKKTNGKEKRKVVLGRDLDILASIKTVIDQLESVQTDYEETIKASMLNEFIAETLAHFKRPDNFRGIGTISEASCEMRVRSSRSPLKPEEVAILKDFNISYEEKVIKEAVPDQFFFNPKLILDNKIASKISAALTSIPELKGQEIIFHQEAQPAVISPVVTDKSFDDAANITDGETLELIYKTIGTLAIKTSIKQGSDLVDLMSLLKNEGIELWAK